MEDLIDCYIILLRQLTARLCRSHKLTQHQRQVACQKSNSFNKNTHTVKETVKSGLPNSPKTKLINGIMLVVFPFPFVQVSF